MKPSHLGVLGIGVLGGSVARCARRHGVRVLGWSPHPAECAAAVREGIVDDVPLRAEDVAAACDFLLLAGDARDNARWLERLGPGLGTDGFVTDLGIPKQPIVASAEALGLADRFAGSRPAAEPAPGDLSGARADLFAGRPVYVTPARGGERAAREVADFWQTVCGAHAVLLDAERHDTLAAFAVQLPALVATALASVLAERLPPGSVTGAAALDLTALARDASRARVEALWQNRTQATAALRAAADAARHLADALDERDATRLATAVEAAAEWRRRFDA